MCLSAGELHKVFKPGTEFDTAWQRFRKRWLYDRPIRLVTGQNVFGHHDFEPRRPLSPWVARYVDWILYRGRFEARSEGYNRFRGENARYRRRDLAECRLLSKALNGTVLATDALREVFPDATFVGLVRNGLAVCEGRTRRGHSVERVGNEYTAVVERMLEYADEMENYHVFRFEDMVSSPVEFARDLYARVGLDVDEVSKFRVEARPLVDATGTRVLHEARYDGQLRWLSRDELAIHFDPEIDAHQIRQLSPEQRDGFLAIAGETLARLGYVDPTRGSGAEPARRGRGRPARRQQRTQRGESGLDRAPDRNATQ